MTNKKITKIIITVVVFVLCFVAGFFIAREIASRKTETDEGISQTTDENGGDETQQAEISEDELKIDHSLYTYLKDGEDIGGGNIEVSEAEYYFYCASVYDELVSYAVQYDYYYGAGSGLSVTGFDYTKPAKEQKYSGEIEGVKDPTYADYIEFTARKQLEAVKSIIEYAKLNSIELTEKEKQFLANNIESARAGIKEQYDQTIEEYLKSVYGPKMTEELFRRITEEQYLMNKIDEIKTKLYTDGYTTEGIEKIYKEKIKTYGVADLRAYIVVADTVIDEGNEKVTKETMAQAKKDAEKFAASVIDDTSFKEKAAYYEQLENNADYEKLLADDSYTLVEAITFDNITVQLGSSELAEWVFEEGRKSGDTFVFEREDTGYGVCMISKPVHKPETTYTYSVRHILFEFTKDGNVDTTADAKILDTKKYDAVIDIDIDPVTTKEPALYMKAQDVLVDYLEGERTEESFGELAKEYSADGNAAQGGIYTDVPQGQMVPEFEGWGIAEGRKPGDVGIVETSYGYHIMYSVDKKVATSWETTVTAAEASEDVNQFLRDLTASYTCKVENYNEQNAEKELEAIGEGLVNFYKKAIGA